MKLGKSKSTFEPRRKQLNDGAKSINRAQTFSYRANRSPKDEKEVKQSRKMLVTRRPSPPRFSWRHLPLLFVAMSSLAFVLSILSLSTNPKIVIPKNSTTTSKTILRDTETYYRAAQSLLQKNLLNRSKITINTESIDLELQQQFPELARVSVTLPLMGRRPIIEVFGVEPKIILTNKSGAFIVDKNGKANAKVADFPSVKSLGLIAIEDQTDTNIEAGKGALDSQSVAFITTFVQQLSRNNIRLSNVVMPASATELRMYLADQKYYIKASLLTDPQIAVGQFLATQKKLVAEKSLPSEYIDVRVEEKVFVK